MAERAPRTGWEQEELSRRRLLPADKTRELTQVGSHEALKTLCEKLEARREREACKEAEKLREEARAELNSITEQAEK